MAPGHGLPPGGGLPASGHPQLAGHGQVQRYLPLLPGGLCCSRGRAETGGPAETPAPKVRARAVTVGGRAETPRPVISVLLLLLLLCPFQPLSALLSSSFFGFPLSVSFKRL